MAPAASATQKPATPAPVPATPPAPAPADAKPAATPAPAATGTSAGAKVEAKAAVAPAAEAKKAEGKKADKKDEKPKKKFDPADLKPIGFGVGFGWLCEELNNGVNKFDDHCGEYFELNPKYRLFFGKGEKHEFDIGGYWSKAWVDREIPTAPGLPADRSRATSDALGLSLEYMFHAVPRWFAAGVRGKIGYVEYNSDQGKVNPDTGSYPEDQFGTVVNASSRGASSYPLDGASGMEASLGLGLYTLSGGLGIRSEFFWHPGVSLHADTVTQGSFDEPINPSGWKFFGLVADPFAIYQHFAGKKSSTTPAPARTPASPPPAAAPATTLAPTTAPTVKAEPTIQDRVKKIAENRSMILALVEGSEEPKVKGNKQIEKEIQGAIAAKASEGQEAKYGRVAELAKLANSQATGVQDLYAETVAEKAAIEAKINAMPEGEEKKTQQENFKKFEAEYFGVKKDDKTSITELVNQSYTSYEKVKAAYEAYVKKNPADYEAYRKKNPNAQKVEFDTPKPETMNPPAAAPAPAAKTAAPAPAKAPAAAPAKAPEKAPEKKPEKAPEKAPEKKPEKAPEKPAGNKPKDKTDQNLENGFNDL